MGGAADVRAKRVLHPLRKVGMVILLGVPATVFACYLIGVPLPQAALGVIVLSIPFFIWPATPQWWCGSCGHRWAAPAPPEEADDEDDDPAEEDDSATGE